MSALGDAIVAEDWPRALALAIEAWRETRAPVHADLVDRIALRLPHALVPNRKIHAWWMAHAARYDAVEAGPWLASARHLTARDGVEPQLFERLEVLARWPDDPRTATVLAAWFADARIGWTYAHREAAHAFYERLAALLVRLRDPRVIAVLAGARPDGKTLGLRELQATLAARVVGALARGGDEPLARGGDEPLPDAAEIARWVPLPASEPAALDERALWRAAAASDGAKLVLADFLLERGDRRGEIITLALHGSRQAQHDSDALLRTYWERWMGELALVLDAGSCTFTGGVLAVATIGTERTPAWAYTKVARHRELATMHTVRPGAVAAKDYVAFLDALPEVPARLRLAADMIEPFARARPVWPAVRALELVTNDEPRVALAATALPAVERIELPIACPLDDVTLRILPALPRLFPRLARVRIDAARPLPADRRQALRSLPAMFEVEHGRY